MTVAAGNCQSWGARAYYKGSRPTNACFRTVQATATGLDSQKSLWVDPRNQEVFTESVEAGVATFICPDSTVDRVAEWSALAAAQFLLYNPEAGTIVPYSAHPESEPSGSGWIGAWKVIKTGEDFKAAERFAMEKTGDVLAGGRPRAVVIDARDWAMIPAENLVAGAQHAARTGGGAAGASSEPAPELLFCAATADEGAALLGALERGVSGVVLRTADPREVRKLLAMMDSSSSAAEHVMRYEVAEVARVEGAGMGDRVCVDLTSRCDSGEGMLVGNFCRALFLVHSECEESAYIAARPFRVNAGPVHAYAAAGGRRTVYLSELRAGSRVVVADAGGHCREADVGRCKIEKRPLTLVSARTSDGLEHSVFLQNAETVRLVGPSEDGGTLEGGEMAGAWQSDKVSTNGGGEAASMRSAWRAVPVTELREGMRVFVLRSDAARHMGMEVEESLLEL